MNLTILVAPLDWGLGHAARCVPIIQYLLQQNHSVIIACTPNQKQILQHTGLYRVEFLEIHGYNISYTKEKRFLPLKILIQVPKILAVIKKENNWLKDLCGKRKIDFVISDNRYGLHTKGIHSVFITHQLRIKAGYSFIENFLQKANYKYINNFSECWIPDFESGQNLSGNLSHTKARPAIPLHYIGPLSRFQKVQQQTKRFDFAVILSGPEPQRTMLEQMIVSVAQLSSYTFFMVKAKPAGSKEIYKVLDNLYVADHLPTEQLSLLVSESEMIISRCGYTTVMEMLSLKKRCILIPTPGQTEQEYLATHLMKQQWCYAFQQHEDFLKHLNMAILFKYNLPDFIFNDFADVVNATLKQIKSS